MIHDPTRALCVPLPAVPTPPPPPSPQWCTPLRACGASWRARAACCSCRRCCSSTWTTAAASSRCTCWVTRRVSGAGQRCGVCLIFCMLLLLGCCGEDEAAGLLTHAPAVRLCRSTAVAVRVKRNSLHLPHWSCGGCQPAATAGAAAAAAGIEGGDEGQPQPLPDLELMDRVSAYPAAKSWGRADTAPKASPAALRCVVPSPGTLVSLSLLPLHSNRNWA